MNDKFYALRVPTRLRGGPHRDKWTVCTYYSCGEPYGYLHNDNDLYEYWLVADSYTTGVFDTRLDALMEIKLYYQRHAQIFPYVTEINEFYELRLPQELLSTGKWGGKWVVRTNHKVDGKPFGYLHNDSKLYDMWFTEKPATVMFESRLDALIETQAYYQHRSEVFPYGKELNDEFIKFTANCTGTHVESQTMVFT